MCGLVRICEHLYGARAECALTQKFTKFAIYGRSKSKMLWDYQFAGLNGRNMIWFSIFAAVVWFSAKISSMSAADELGRSAD
jgi:hypothetical protein